MRDLIWSTATVGLSILANLLTPTVQKMFGIKSGFHLLNYWYIFVILILIGAVWDTLRILLDKDKSDLWRGRVAYLLLLIQHTKEKEKK